MDLYALNKVEFGYSSLDEAFPDVDPGMAPCGDSVLFQIRTPKRTTKGGIILPGSVKETESWNTQVAKVVAVGPMAFKYADGAEWPEGRWYDVGDFVRVPKYGGDRWTIQHGDGEDAIEIMFVLLLAKDVRAKITGDPLSVKTYI